SGAIRIDEANDLELLGGHRVHAAAIRKNGIALVLELKSLEKPFPRDVQAIGVLLVLLIQCVYRLDIGISQKLI
ncbi:MAG: hypothetical protein RL062_979, partial [Bacteroidota bacterium]